MTPALSFRISDVAVDLCCDLPEVVNGLRVVWGACAAGPLPVARRVRVAVETRDDGWWIFLDGKHVGGGPSPSALLPLLEACLYRALPSWHSPPRALLHAALVAFGDRGILLAGASGAGKSSLARALVASGGRYMTDELAVTDGRRLWGIPRAIQFDPVPVGDAPPPWLGAVDLSSYRMHLEDGQEAVLPLSPVPTERLRIEPLDAARVALVLPSRSIPAGLREGTAAEGLAALHAGAFSPVDVDLGALVGTGRVLHLGWERPEPAAAWLLERLGHAPAASG